ncbi:mitochondrial carrier [Auriscalpium vulgare]|uniref:Mitochondrial carrier n=1 Tax=Auriscalpium vulgare TaxID=40419 RepID=A0ACB8RZ00_9AGAM|nr:mitochondrial carrier [Auriscalpium vulgare]
MTSTLPPIVQAFSGAMGSAASNAVAYPLDLITTRQQTTKNSNLLGLRGALSIVRYTIHKHGIDALYDGLGSDTASTILSNFCYFYAYTLLRALVLRRAQRSPSSSRPTAAVLSVPQELVLGFVAGVASKLVSTPLSIVTVRLQTAREDDEDTAATDASEVDAEEDLDSGGSGLLAVVRAIYREEGLTGFWRGFRTTFILCLNPSLTFALLQVYRRLFVRTPSTRRAGVVSPGHAFLGAAVANSLANAILYPLILAKTRAQLSPPPPSPPPATSMSALSLPDMATTTPRINITLPSDPHLSLSGEKPAASAEKPAARPALSRRATQAALPYPGGAYQGLSAQIAKGFVGQGLTFLVKQRVETAFVQLSAGRRA